MSAPAYSALARGRHLFALSGFAVAQPLLALLAEQAQFLVAHRAGRLEIGLLLFALLVAAPALLWLLESFARLLGPGLARGVHLLLVGLLAGAAVLPPLGRIPGLPGVIVLILAAALGAAALLAYARLPLVRSFASVLAIGPVVFVVVFLANPSVSKLVAPRAAAAISPPVSQLGAESPAIVMLVFDELPTISLLDAEGRIDSVRYPNFARLAADATWFRNASAVHYKTSFALPPLLTGRYPDRSLLPIASDHPENLFTLLAGAYELNVVETFTRLAQRKGSEDDSLAVALQRTRRMLEDLSVVEAHVLLPDDLTTGLPSIERTWRNFARAERGPRRRGMSSERRSELFGDRPGRFQSFVASIQPGEQPTLHFHHVMLPHRPWHYLPSGRSYHPSNDLGVGRGPWSEQQWWAVDGYQKHLLQLEFTDALLGTLLARLEELGLYDSALIVVASDHGVGFWPGQPQRSPKMRRPGDVLGVPLLVKRPFQAVGRVSMRNVELVDVMPTIADVLGVEVPWEIDGCSAFSAGCPPRGRKAMYFDDGTQLLFPPEVDLMGESLARKLSLFGSRSRATRVSAWGRHAGMLGKRVAAVDVLDEGRAVVELERASFDLAVRHPSVYAVARITGRVRAPGAGRERLHIAVAVDGTVRAVAVAEPSDRGHFFSAFLPEEAQPKRVEQLALFIVRGFPDSPTLVRARVAFR